MRQDSPSHPSVAKLRRINAYTENGIDCPTIILTGSEDGTHRSAFALIARIPNCELKILPGAGHACQIEPPWLSDHFMIEFLTKHGLFPAASKPGQVGEPVQGLRRPLSLPNVRSEAEVDAIFVRLKDNGATTLKNPQEAF